MKTADVRKQFLSFFADRGHEVVHSSPLVLPNDPTLLFANAGMNQFKDTFVGTETRPYRRATTAQKCVRAGGKHNDLENVGFTARHHTFFEMLGNFSFGDYFKAEAIEFAHTLLTKELGLDPKRLIYTVFGGDASLPGIEADSEASELWQKIAGVSQERVLGLGASENFWQMGDTGPMGPCSEIHYYLGDDWEQHRKAGTTPEYNDDSWLEIWNLVFMQYERKEVGGELTNLPARSVDTGAGLERLASVLNGKSSNYDIDLFQELVHLAASLCGKEYGADQRDDASMRVIADHARATAFLVADGVFPDKTGREYVLRRIFRRAVRHGQKLGIGEPFMHAVCTKVIDLMGDAYPELVERKEVVAQIAIEEETRFRKTLERGLRLLEDEFESMEVKGAKTVAGEKVFQLYDTYGFPADLTGVIARERGYQVDDAGFDVAMERAQARSEFKGQGEAVISAYKKLAEEFGQTRFCGYENEQADSQVLAILRDGKRVETATENDEVALVLLETPFYGESGGQIGDAGEIACAAALVAIQDSIKPAGGVIVHRGKVQRGVISVGDAVSARVATEARAHIRANHSATHLLHMALRQVLGEHAAQKGSLVTAERLRFDFSHFSPLSTGEREQVETIVNKHIWENVASSIEVLPMDEAKQRGAVHMFGEKYGDQVRVVQIGRRSLEFCGGTHVRRSGDIGFFKITSESGIAQGVRRIEAVTGASALAHVRRIENELSVTSEHLKSSPLEAAGKAQKLVSDLKHLDKEVAALKQRLATGGAKDLMDSVREVAGVRVLVSRLDDADAKTLREVGDKLRDRIQSGVVVLAGTQNGKVGIITVVTKDLTGRFHAGKIASKVAAVVGGKGGGRPDMAQAGGSDPTKVDQALDSVYDIIGS